MTDLKKLEEEAKRTGKKLEFRADGSVHLVPKKAQEKKVFWESDLIKSRKILDDRSEID